MTSPLSELMHQGVIIQVPKEQEEGEGFYAHIFLVKKPSGKLRLILNWKILNRSIRYKRFRMDTFFSIRTAHPQLFYGVNSIKGCIPAHPNCKLVTKVSTTGSQPGRGDMSSPVQGSALRPLLLAQSVYKSYGRGLGAPEAEGGHHSALDDLLLFCRIQGSSSNQPASNLEAPRFGLACKSTEVQSNPSLAGDIPIVRDRFDTTEFFSQEKS